jgi:uncharacterized protein
MAQRLEERGKKPAPIYYRRTFILLLVGLAHGGLLWNGDILYSYAMCGFFVFLFRKKQPRTLVLLGLLTLAVGTILSLGGQLSLPTWPKEAVVQLQAGWSPTAEQVAAELEAFRGGWTAQNAMRIPNALSMWTGAFFFFLAWRAGGMMLLGMGLYKLGGFDARLPPAAYRKMVVVGFLSGLPLALAGVWFHYSGGWALETSFFGGTLFNYWGSVPVALAWVGVVMLFCQSRGGSRIYRALAAAGQMALTNYLTQTLICTTIFYGHGFGAFGRVGRAEQLLVVFGVWMVQLVWSPWWLARFRFGPFEWLWRSLTYRRIQPLRRRQPEVASPTGAA